MQTQAWKPNQHIKTHIFSFTVHANGTYWTLSTSHLLLWPTTHLTRNHSWHFWVNSHWTTGLWAALTYYVVLLLHTYFNAHICMCTHTIAHTVLTWECAYWSPHQSLLMRHTHTSSIIGQTVFLRDSSCVSCMQLRGLLTVHFVFGHG